MLIYLLIFLKKNNEFRYAGHKTTKIENKISTRDTQVINHILLTKVDNNIINDVEEKYNPNIVKKEEEREMALLDELKKLVASVEKAKEDFYTTYQKDKCIKK